MLSKNQLAPSINTVSLTGEPLGLADLRREKKVLVKFHRFSGCPVARRQIHELVAGQDELSAAGIETIVILHSSKDNLIPNFTEVPGLHIVADRDKRLYREYHSAFLLRKIFSLGSWRAIFTSFARGYFPQFSRFQGGIAGVPSDFLVDRDGVIVNLHYGKHYGDSWTVAQALEAAA